MEKEEIIEIEDLENPKEIEGKNLIENKVGLENYILIPKKMKHKKPKTKCTCGNKTHRSMIRHCCLMQFILLFIISSMITLYLFNSIGFAVLIFSSFSILTYSILKWCQLLYSSICDSKISSFLCLEGDDKNRVGYVIKRIE
jgi:hypothetical protein